MTPKYRVEDFDLILELVRKYCKHERIEDFLRKAKELNPEVRLSGPSDELVFRHLKDLVRDNESMRDKICDMLADSEESGQQHIFLYRPKNEIIKTAASDAEAIACKLFGPDRRKSMNFPSLLARPHGEQWADFRIEPGNGPKSGWTAKLYVGALRWESQGLTHQDDETKIEIWKQRLSREIKLVRWRNDGILELRTPHEAKRNDVLNSVGSLWNAIGAGLSETDFEPYNLNPACMKLIEKHQDHADLCRLGDARVQDDQMGSARFTPPSGRDHLMGNLTREKAIRLYRLCNELVVTWYLNREAHDAQEELRTAVGKYGVHNIHIRARTTGKAIQHVTDQLRWLG